MAQLWGGRFQKQTDKAAYEFNASIRFDKRLYRQDIRGSIAHVTMLAKQGIIEVAEKDQIITALKGICEDIEKGVIVADKNMRISIPWWKPILSSA